MRETGVSGYEYVEVDDDVSVNVIFANNALIRLANDQIPNDAMVGQQYTIRDINQQSVS